MGVGARGDDEDIDVGVCSDGAVGGVAVGYFGVQVVVFDGGLAGGDGGVAESDDLVVG